MTSRLMLLGLMIAAVLARVGVGAPSAAGGWLCVGGPHCYASIQAAVTPRTKARQSGSRPARMRAG